MRPALGRGARELTKHHGPSGCCFGYRCHFAAAVENYPADSCSRQAVPTCSRSADRLKLLPDRPRLVAGARRQGGFVMFSVLSNMKTEQARDVAKEEKLVDFRKAALVAASR